MSMPTCLLGNTCAAGRTMFREASLPEAKETLFLLSASPTMGSTGRCPRSSPPLRSLCSVTSPQGEAPGAGLRAPRAVWHYDLPGAGKVSSREGG